MRPVPLGLVLVLATATAHAQEPLVPLEAAAFAPPGLFHSTPFEVGSGAMANPGPAPLDVWSDGVVVPWATSLVLHFSIADLGTDDDWIEVHGLADGETQILDRTRLQQWRNESAHFNGGVVVLTLHLAPGSTGRVEVDLVYAGSVPGAPETICGTGDDRFVSTDVRVGRLVINNNGICTGWLQGLTSTIVTAGHCGWANPITSYRAEFNVPASTSAGAIVAPPVADQFPVEVNTVLFEDTGGVGSDWAVVRLHPNSSGQTAFARQGASFPLATSLPGGFLPFAGPAVNVKGFGIDGGTVNLTQQQATGVLDSISGNSVFHHADTEGGCSGGPVVLASTGQVIAIHTDGGCTSSANSSNGATSILRPGLQAAIAAVSGCAFVSLVDGTPSPITCSDTIFSITPVAAKWNVVGVSSVSDWDLEMDGVSSAAPGNDCDFLLANGHLGALPQLSGSLHRSFGPSPATAQFDSADHVSLSSPFNTTWSATAIAQIYEVNVNNLSPPFGGPPPLSILVFGDPSLSWRLYSPGTDASWRSRDSGTLMASGAVGGNVVSGLSVSPIGFHALVVFRDGNSAAPSPSALTIGVFATSTVDPLVVNTETSVFGADVFSITPGTNSWNAVAVGAASGTTFEVYVGAGQSTLSGTVTNFVLADGNPGAIGTTSGYLDRSSGSGTGTAVHETASTLFVGGQFDTSLFSGRMLDLFEFNAAAAGNFTVTITGGAGPATLSWRVFAPSGGTQWITRSDAVAAGTVGGATATVALGAGVHALAVYVDGAPVTVTQPYSISVCQAVATLNLGTTGTAAITAACQTFQFTSTAGRWHAIGLSSAAASNWDLGIGAAESELGAGSAEFLVANGNLGTVSLTAGIAVRESGASPAQIDYDSVDSVTLGGTSADSVNASETLEIFELTVATAGSYEIGVTGSVALKWALFSPGTSSAWRSRSASFQSGTVPGGATVSLTPGVWALIVFREVPTGVNENFIASFALTPSPVPILSAITPNAAISLGAGFTLTANGSEFVAMSVVHWNGSPLATVFVSANQLTATVPASLIAGAGTASVTVFSPAPGGGTSAAQTFTISNPVPVLSALSPASATSGGGAVAVALNGSNFRASTQPRFNGTPLASTFVSTTQINATVPSSLMPIGATASITLVTPAPGGGTSGAQTFTINNPVPGLTSISPSSAIAGGSSFVLTLTASDFNSTSTVRWNGTTIAIANVILNQITVLVPASLIASAGTALVRVFNPAPGGGTSAPLTFTINNPAPSLASLVPNVVVAGSPAMTVNVNGSSFVATSVVEVNNTPVPTAFASAAQVQATLSAALLTTPGILVTRVRNPAPGGGLSGLVTLGLSGPALLAVSPATMAAMTPASPSLPVIATGLNFLAASVVHANGTPLATTLVNSTTLTATLGPSILQAQRPGGIAIHVTNSATAVSNGQVIEVGSWDNDGLISRRPLNPAPGGTYSAFLEDLPPNTLFSLYVDGDNVAPVGPFIDPTMNNVLAVSSFAGSSMAIFIPLVESFGLFGPANPVATSAQGTFTIPGFVLPNPAIGLHLTVQGLYLDPTAPYGIRLTWARFPDSF